ncbi:MAG: flavodoxin domain-containing protein [Candidatus Heimdallarchaeaceae archaeon]
MTKNTVIVYETYYGATKQAAFNIAKILEEKFNHNVVVHNIGKDRDCPDLSTCDNVIIGSCIYNGTWASHAENFLSNKFEGKKTALFVCSMFAGEKTLYKQAFRAYLSNKLEKYKHIKPVSLEAFGGRVPEQEYPDEWVAQVASKLPTFTTDNKDLAKVDKWAMELGELL